MSRHVAITGVGKVRDGALPALAEVDASRLRRMDLFGRMGFLAGSAALVHRGLERRVEGDRRAGIFFGTAYGCRDSITRHDALLRAAARVEELSPAVFAQTVHNTVAGELAIAWGLCGASEVVTSGRTAGLEALLFAAARIEEGVLDLALCGAAEGLPQEMRAAGIGGPQGTGSGAALVLEGAPLGGRALATVLGGASFFEPDPETAAARFLEGLADASGSQRGDVLLATRDLGTALEAALARHAPDGWGLRYPASGESDLLSVAGPMAIVDELARDGRDGLVAVVVRDAVGPTAWVLIESG